MRFFIYFNSFPSISGCHPFQKNIARQPFGRTKMLIPLFVVTSIPLVSVIPPVKFLYSFWDGMMMLTFTGSLIENHPYVIFMTSGNYRKDADGLYRIIRGKGIWVEYRRQPWITELSLEFCRELLAWPSSCISSTNGPSGWSQPTSLIMTYYTARVKQLGLQTDIYNRTSYEVLLLLCDFSPSRSVRCETKPPAMRCASKVIPKKNSKRDTIKVFKPIVKRKEKIWLKST